VPYSFRLHFRLPQQLAVGCAKSQWTLPPLGTNAELSLRSLKPDVPIEESKDLIVRGEGCASHITAMEAGETARNCLTLAFARTRIGADFGNRAAQGVILPAGLKMLEEQTGQRVLNDVHGLKAFESGSNTKFAAFSTDAIVVKNIDSIVEALRLAEKDAGLVSETHRLAYDLFSASFFQPSPDSRFLMLMMAIETLIDLSPRSEAVANHVRSLIHLTSESPQLPRNDKAAIGQAGRGLVSSLGGINYQGDTPKELFTKSYDLRSKLVHGNKPRPTRGEVDNIAARVETLVADLLCRPLLPEMKI
jgi:hypothetical protein